MRLLAAALLVAACGALPGPGASDSAPPAPRKAPPGVEARSLPCFACHAYEAWEKSERFPHGEKPHQKAGHCHVCHLGLGHHGSAIDLPRCRSCHGDEIPGRDEEAD